MSEEEARQWPDLMQIIEEKVKPQRIKDKRDIRRKYWWRFGETDSCAIQCHSRYGEGFWLFRGCMQLVLLSFPRGSYLQNSLLCFHLKRYAAFVLLQSRIHEDLVPFFSSETDLDLIRYAPSDCFETFPFPENFETNSFVSKP